MEASRIKPEFKKNVSIVFAVLIALVLWITAFIDTTKAQTTENFSGNIAANMGTGHMDVPFGLKVFQNNPEPFTASTSISFETSTSANLKLAIYDADGNLVKAYLFDNISSGSHQVKLDGSEYPAGVYKYRFISGNYSQSYSMTVVK